MGVEGMLGGFKERRSYLEEMGTTDDCHYPHDGGSSVTWPRVSLMDWVEDMGMF